MAVVQIGERNRCGKAHCENRAQWRVILGAYRVQAYACSPHLTWACKLDRIGQSRAEKLGWPIGHPVPGGYIVQNTTCQVEYLGSVTIRSYVVDSEDLGMRQITR